MKMKLLMVLMATALLLSISGTTQGITFRYGYDGPVTMKFTNWDMGVLYNAPAVPAIGIPAVNAFEVFAYPSANGNYYDHLGNVVPVNDVNREDMWGIGQITRIYPTGGNPVTDVLWLPGDDGVELSALFYGERDNALVDAGIALPGFQVIAGQGLQFDMYENPVDHFNDAGGALQGSSGRTGFNTYNGITDGTLVASLLSQPNVGGPNPGVNDEFVSIFKPNATFTTGEGTFTSYMELDPCTAAAQRDYDQFNTDAMTPWLYDFTIDGTTIPNDGSVGPIVSDWIVLSEDPIRGNAVIPEPVTMLGVFLGLGSLTSYIRRRFV